MCILDLLDGISPVICGNRHPETARLEEREMEINQTQSMYMHIRRSRRWLLSSWIHYRRSVNCIGTIRSSIRNSPSRDWLIQLESIHDIITHDANSVSWPEIWEFSKSQHDINDAVVITKMIVFDINCCVYHHFAAKIKFPILQLSNMAAKCGIRYLGNRKWNWILVARAK